MKVVIYKAKGDFEGTAKVELPSRRNRLKVLKKHMGIFVEGESQKAGVELYEDLYKLAEKIVKEVKIVHKESGKKYKSFMEMSEDSLCDDICEEILKMLMDGESLGEA